MEGRYSFDPVAVLMTMLGTIVTAWVGITHKSVSRHEVEIAVLKAGQSHIVKSLDRLEDHLGTKPQEEE